MSTRRTVTLAEIAQRAGVSSATVSLALRNSDKIHSQTKDRVRRVAALLGYTPDPLLGKLMAHLRLRKKKGITGSMVGLYFEKDSTPHMARYLETAKYQANELGYSFSIEEIPTKAERLQAHQKTIWSRGVEGLLLLPCRLPMTAHNLYRWELYSVVSVSANPQLPDCDRVLINWYNAVRVTCQQLKERGYRRIGFVLGMNLDYLFKHLLSAALIEQQAVPDSMLVAPLFYLPETADLCSPYLSPGFLKLTETRVHPITQQPLETLTESLCDWYNTKAPDVLVFDCENMAVSSLQKLREHRPGPYPATVLSRHPKSFFAGMEMPLEAAAKSAVELLSLKIQRGVRGLPEQPFEQLYKGKWKDGESLPPCEPAKN